MTLSTQGRQFKSYAQVVAWAETQRPEVQQQVEESRRLFRADQDEAWGNRKVSTQTPKDYLEKEERAWEKHMDRLSLIRGGRGAKWSLCRACGTERISTGKKFCAGCKIKRRKEARRGVNK